MADTACASVQTRKADPQTFLIHEAKSVKVLEKYLLRNKRRVVKVSPRAGAPETEEVCCAQITNGKAEACDVIVYNDQGQCTPEFMRNVARQIILPNRSEFHDDFRIWLATDSPLEELPSLLTRNCVEVGNVEWENETPNINVRDLIVAVEDRFTYQIEEFLPQILLMTPSQQVELVRTASTEEVALKLLAGDLSWVPGAQNADGESILDIGIARYWYTFVEKAIHAGSKTDILDFEEMLSPVNAQMLELLLANYGQALDVVVAVHKTAVDGNVRVMRSLFDHRVDISFNYKNYPLTQAVNGGHRELTQVIIDRMDWVGLPPYNEPRIAFHFLLELFKPLEDRDGPKDFTEWHEFRLEMAISYCDHISGQHDIPYQFIEDVIVHDKSHPLVVKLLQLVDVEQDPSHYFDLFLQYDPDNPMIIECLKLHLHNVVIGGVSITNTKLELFRRIILKGDEVAGLTKVMLDDGISCNFKLIMRDPEDPSVERERTPLMMCMELPGSPESLKMILRRKDTEINIKNERGLNALQQTVVDILNDPLDYLDHLDTYGMMFEDLLLKGIDPNATRPAFFTSLFSYLAKLEMGSLCLPLFHTTLNKNIILHTSGNLLTNMANVTFDRISTGYWDCENPWAHLDIRFNNAQPRDKFGLHSLIPMPDSVVLNIMRYQSHSDLHSLGMTCLRFHLLSLSNELWMRHCDVIKESMANPTTVNTNIMSMKAYYKALKTGHMPHLYIKTGEDKLTCAVTGVSINRRDLPSA